MWKWYTLPNDMMHQNKMNGNKYINFKNRPDTYYENSMMWLTTTVRKSSKSQVLLYYKENRTTTTRIFCNAGDKKKVPIKKDILDKPIKAIRNRKMGEADKGGWSATNKDYGKSGYVSELMQNFYN